MTLAESVFLDGVPLGRVVWDTDSKRARFEPRHEALRPLAAIEWPDPVDARTAAQDYAAQIGLGVAS